MAEKEKQEKEDSFRHIVRVANTDIDGNKAVGFALKKVKGVSYSFANAICQLANVDASKKAGMLNDAEVKKLNEMVGSPSKYGVPAWMLNRKKDPETGEDRHLLGGDLQFTKETDIKILKKIKSYRGTRHMHGLPVRGQRTKSNFRKSKSRGKGSLGVARKKASKKGGK